MIDEIERIERFCPWCKTKVYITYLPGCRDGAMSQLRRYLIDHRKSCRYAAQIEQEKEDGKV